MRTDFQNMLVEQDESVVTLTMNRPDVLNAINTLMLEELTEAVEAAAHHDAIRCVVLAGAGRAFGAGQDLTEFASAHASGETHLVSDQLAKYHRLLLAIHHMPKPVIAAMQGIATGITVNIALACDIRIAADNARLREGFALIGLVPDGGGGYHLPRLIGLGRALEMALLAEDVSGAEAERIGLVNRCVPLAEHWRSGWQMDPLAHMSSSKSSCIGRWIWTCKPPSILRDNYKKPPTLQRITEKV